MTAATSPPDHSDLLRQWGFWAALAGALALVLVALQTVLPSLEEAPSAAQQIGAMAGEMKRAAWLSFLGLSEPAPTPEPAATPLWVYMGLAAPVVAGVAIVLSVIAALRGETRRFAWFGAGLGVGAIVLQVFWWVALLIAGIALLIAIIQNLGEFFSF